MPDSYRFRRTARTLSCVSDAAIPIEERWPRPAVMGVLNVTPDSFSDGGQFVSARGRDRARPPARRGGRRARRRGRRVDAARARSPWTPTRSSRRVVPVLEGLAGIPLSIDTSKAAVARRALELGAELVNDVTALRGDPELAGVVAEGGAYVCLMHMQGEPRTMQAAPRYDDVASEVFAFLEERVAFAVDAGIPEERICVDPGIGFGKTPDQNLELVRRLDSLVALGARSSSASRARARSRACSATPSGTRGSLASSLGAAVAAFERGAWMLRAHDVRETVEALAVAAAVERGKVTA